jgi:fatty acid amide hydrolase
MQKSRASSELVRLSAVEMARRIVDGELTSVELVEAHMERIEAVNPRLNAVVIKRYAEARAEAAAADAARARGDKLPPLHGVPMTVKECFHLAGTVATEGVHQFAHQISTVDNPLVHRLRAAGAIVLGKTNLPQLMLMHETDNPVYGRTNNPWDLARGPGGSSGGEGAIIAVGGSPLGLANDIGGSIRHPAHSCGVCGLKPTTLRLTNALVRDNLRGMEAIRPACGPIARNVDDLYLALRVLLDGDPRDIDPQIAPVPLGDPRHVDVGGLKVGVWTDDGFFPPAPAIRRAVEESAQALTQLGAQVEPFQPPRIDRAVQLFFGLLGADGGADAERVLGRSPRDWRVRRLIMLCKSPGWLRHLANIPLRWAGQERTAFLLSAIGRRSTDRYWQLSAARVEYAERFFSQWSAAGLDVLLCPPHALPALRHGSTADLPLSGSYGYWANLLGVPSGVVPVTRVRQEEQSDRPASRDLVERAAIAVEQGSAGLPVGVQVAARPWREDVVLAAMKALENHFRPLADYPRTPIDPALPE